MNEQFFQDIDEFAAEVRQQCRLQAMKIAGNMLQEITDINALDTGRCTASWVAAVNQPVFYVALDVTEYNRLSREAAQERSMATLMNLADYELGDIMHLANGTDYVSGIEDGTNSVKSIAFVRLTALRYFYAGLINYQLIYGE